MQPRRYVLPFATLLIGGVFMWTLATGASAQISSPCTATMNGRDVNSISTSGTALEVPFDGTVSINFVSSGAITGHNVKLDFGGGIPWTVASGTDNGNSWSDSVAVAKYSKYGVGLYRVTGETLGAGACSGSAFVHVTGKSPLSTPAGAGGAAAAAIGAIGMLGAGAVSASKAAAYSELEDDLLMLEMYGCFWALPLAMLRTTAFMVVGAGAPGAPAAMIRWRPYFSGVSIIGSLLAGLGTLVLGQQYALFFPTRMFTIIWLIVWLLMGIAIPSLGRLIAVKKANRIRAHRAAQPPAQPASQDQQS